MITSRKGTVPVTSSETTKRRGRTQAPSVFAGYIRVSRVGERDERLRSPTFQRRAIDGKAQAEGVGVKWFKPELDVSGAKRNRAVLDDVVARIERGELAGIIVYNLSRLSRLKPSERIELVERIEGSGGKIVSTCEAFDPETPDGRFQRELFFSLARREWEIAAESFAASKENAIANGIAVKSVAPFGYRFDEHHRLEVVEREARIVRELFAMRRGGASLGAIVDLLESRTGRRSSRTAMRYLLRNRAYLGELTYGRETPLVKVDAHKPIVELELFDAVQHAIDARSRAHGYAGGGKAKSLLAGIAKCQGCGRGLTCGRTGRNHVYRYSCPNDARHCDARGSAVATELDAHVIERVLAELGPIVDELVEVTVGVVPDERAGAEARLADAERSLLEWSAELELEEREPEAYRVGLDARRQRAELRRSELDALGEATVLESARATLRQALSGRLLDDGGDALETAERRQLLAVVLDAVVVRKAPRGTTIAERADVLFATSAPTSDGLEDALELGD